MSNDRHLWQPQPTSPLSSLHNHILPLQNDQDESNPSSPHPTIQPDNHNSESHIPFPRLSLELSHSENPKETLIAEITHDSLSGRKIINDYEILGELGRGNFGKVKLGRNLKNDRRVAIKILDRVSKKRRFGRSDNQEEKIKREIAILKKARHDNIVGLYEVIDDPALKKVYIVLEYAEIGEVQWRSDGSIEPEICIVEYRRSLREQTDLLSDSRAIQEDNLIIDQHKLYEQYKKYKQSKEGEAAAEAWTLEYDENPIPKPTNMFDPYNLNDDEEIDPKFSKTGSFETNYKGSYGEIESAFHELPKNFQFVPLMSLSECRRTFRDTLLGLEYLHYHRVYHRDLKPANLLETKNHRIKISDFGVSYLGKTVLDQHDSEDDFSKDDLDDGTELAKTVGTPAFYAPELCDNEQNYPVTHKIDIWSLGVTLYCFVYGRVPFHHENPFRIMNMISTKHVPIPKQRLKIRIDHGNHNYDGTSDHHEKRFSNQLEHEEIPESLQDLLSKLLVKNPTERIDIDQIKKHQWLLDDIQNPNEWIDKSDPSKLTKGKKIEVSKEDVDSAVRINMVVPLLKTMQKIGGVIGLGNKHRTRSKSTTSDFINPKKGAEKVSTNFLDDHSLKNTQVTSTSRKSYSLTSSPILKSSTSSQQRPVSQNGLYISEKTDPEYGMTTTNSIQTIRQSDFDDHLKSKDKAAENDNNYENEVENEHEDVVKNGNVVKNENENENENKNDVKNDNDNDSIIENAKDNLSDYNDNIHNKTPSSTDIELPSSPLINLFGGLKNKFVQGVVSLGNEVSRMASPGFKSDEDNYSNSSNRTSRTHSATDFENHFMAESLSSSATSPERSQAERSQADRFDITSLSLPSSLSSTTTTPLSSKFLPLIEEGTRPKYTSRDDEINKAKNQQLHRLIQEEIQHRSSSPSPKSSSLLSSPYSKPEVGEGNIENIEDIKNIENIDNQCPPSPDDDVYQLNYGQKSISNSSLYSSNDQVLPSHSNSAHSLETDFSEINTFQRYQNQELLLSTGINNFQKQNFNVMDTADSDDGFLVMSRPRKPSLKTNLSDINSCSNLPPNK